MAHPHLVRNVALIGHLHHGKTSILDVLVKAVHKSGDAVGKLGHEGFTADSEQTRYTDTRGDEQKRALSIKATPVSLLLQVSIKHPLSSNLFLRGSLCSSLTQTPTEKHYLFNLVDTPGHTNFSDEVINCCSFNGTR